MSEKIVNFDQLKATDEWKKYSKLAVFLVITIGLVLFLLNNLFIVQQGEFRVVRQFGEVVRVIEEPGLNVKIPFIQSVTTLTKKQIILDVEPTEINTRDKKRILIDNYAIWKIDNPQLMIANAQTNDRAEAIMMNFIYSVIRAELGQLDYDEIINDESSSRGSFNDRVLNRVNELLTRDNYGISVTDVRMKRIDLPEENEDAVYRRMISERNSIAQDYLSQGDAEANRIRANTDREVKEIVAKASADANEIIGLGEAGAAQLYNESFGKDVEFYNLYRTLQSYEKTIDDQTVIVLPADSPYARILMGYTN
jgi:membrane protease subunit HflC